MANRRGRIYRRTRKDLITGEFVETGPYWIQYWFNGKDRRESSRSTKRSVAERLLCKRMSGKDAGTLVVANLKPIRFEDLQALIEADYIKKENRSLNRMRDAFKALHGMFAGWTAQAITDQRLNEYFTMRLNEGKSRATVVYELRCLRRAFKLAKLPVPGFECGPLNNARRGFFEPSQFEAVLNQLPPYLRAPLRMGALTSWRVQSEILSLEWSHIDLVNKVIRLDARNSKNKEPRVFPYAQFPDLAKVIEDQRAEADRIQRQRGMIIPMVFFRETHTGVLRIKSYKTAWKLARARAGFPEKLVHDLRRTGVRSFRQAGIPESVSMKLSGHLTRNVFLRYDIIDDKDLQAGVAQLGKFHAQAAIRDTYRTIVPIPNVQGEATNG